ncbi:hypothetical protein C8F04DRAFT_1104090 [Mycena alexandri]|uniref:Uncharacterized protein n=1 Tax=Mycena alexandri TaxID=1745969 RepID=A0AAD6SW24_9AGAR|nr:hypothetical protein C8F04DRAFT_1104090 [Mycena alexandri]
MPSLLSLTIGFGTAEIPIATFVLSRLRHLHLRSGAAWALQFLHTLESPDMESMSFLPLGQAWPDGAARGIADVVASRWARTLRAFTLTADRIHDVAALAACPHVARFALRVRTPPGGAFDIDAFVGIGRKGAGLSSLSLPPTAGIELASLSRFAALWPALAFLKLNLINLAPVPSLATTSVLSHGLKHLVFHSAAPRQEGDTRRLAHHLDRLFPRLDSVRDGGHAGEESVPTGPACLPGVSESGGIGIVHPPWATVLEEVFRCQDARRLGG